MTRTLVTVVRHLWLTIALLAATVPAQARWLQATTPHFVVHAELDERTLRIEATRLEQFHRLLTALLHLDATAPAPRLDVYLVGSPGDLRTIDPSLSKLEGTAAGYYRATRSGTVAYAAWDSSSRETSRHILYHEYVHHLVARGAPVGLPLWLSEGIADYFGATEIDDGKALIGEAPTMRVGSLAHGRWLEMRRLVEASSYRDAASQLDMLYAQGWLLTHYLLRDPARAAALRGYLAAIGTGAADEKAFVAAFGTSYAAMDQMLAAYARTGLTYQAIPLKPLAPGEVTVAPMPPASDDLLLLSLRLTTGRRDESPGEAAAVLARVRAAAARHPDDPFAQRTLAHAEQVFGDAKVAAAMLATLPATDPYAQYLLGVSLLAAAPDRDARIAALPQAKAAFARAVKRDATFYPALYRYAETLPAGSAARLDALVAAEVLAPQVDALRIDATLALIAAAAWPEAVAMAEPLAHSPHPNRDAIAAQVLTEAARRAQPITAAGLRAAVARRLQAGAQG